MTCQETQALLEIYLDDETSDKQAEKVKEHLAQCEACRIDHEEMVLLRELLTNNRTSPNSDEYWDETTRLIMAKTVESEASIIPVNSLQQEASQKKSAFYKSLISVAASLFILTASVMLGNNKDNASFTRELTVDKPVFSIIPQEKKDMLSEYVSNDSRIKQMGSRIILGAPGLAGRAALINEIADLESK